MFFRSVDLGEAGNHLPRYYAIRDGKRMAKYLLARNVFLPVSNKDIRTTGQQELWELHSEGMDSLRVLLSESRQCSDETPTEKGHVSLMEIKAELARRFYTSCEICEHRCRVDRTREKGFCGVWEPYLSSEFLHTGEEPELVPSHTFFFSGCTFRCVFCQNWDTPSIPAREPPPTRAAFSAGSWQGLGTRPT